MSPHDGDVPFEDDPTGMRALLAGLPDPGPMPDDLVARIQASLLSESRSRAADAQTPHSIPQPPTAPARHGASIPAGRKRPLGQWIFGLAAAGLVVAGGGYALRGAAGGSDAAGGAVSMGSAEAGSHSTSTSFAGGDASSSTKAASDDATVQGTVQVDGGGPTYTVKDLPEEAEGVVARAQDSPPSGFTPDGPFGDAERVEACLISLGMRPGDRSVVQVGTYGERAAAIVTYAEPGASTWTAYLVGPSCGLGTSDAIAGPVSVPAKASGGTNTP